MWFETRKALVWVTVTAALASAALLASSGGGTHGAGWGNDTAWIRPLATLQTAGAAAVAGTASAAPVGRSR